MGGDHIRSAYMDSLPPAMRQGILSFERRPDEDIHQLERRMQLATDPSVHSDGDI